jgi:gliding motility-associated-like protein
VHQKVRFIFLLFLCSLYSRSQNDARAVVPHVNPAIRFSENKGQWDARVLFRAQVDGGLVFVEKNCMTYNFYDRIKFRALHQGALARGEYKDFSIRGHAYRVSFLNSIEPLVQKEQQCAGYENYYKGSDREKWKSNVMSYDRIWLKNLYHKIDYELVTSANGFKYNFYVKPGGDVKDIKMRYEGVNDVKIVDGRLIVTSEVNQVVEQKPYAYQLINGAVEPVTCVYKFKNKTLWFDFPQGYNKAYELVIDPVLVFAAQIGSVADNFGMTATFDNNGNLYSGGTVFDNGYPVTTGAYSNTFSSTPGYGSTDVFITKYNSAGNALLFSTYIGGSGTEIVSSLIVDKNNNLCLYGATGSADFPITSGAAFATFGGGTGIGFINNGSVFFNGTDIFITKFNASGSVLLGSTFYGGNGNDGMNYLAGTTSIIWPGSSNAVNTSGYDSLMMNYGDQYRGEIQLDSLDNIYVASSTRSSTLPIVGGFDNSLGGAQDALILKFNANLTSLLYSSYIGGSQQECGNALFVTPLLEVYVTGGTTSSNFPNTSGGHSSVYNGGKSDGFLAKISANGSALLQSTYIGTSQYDNSFFVQCDVQGRPYVYGQSLGNMPVIASPSLPIYSNSNTHQFISRYNAALTQMNMSTVFGNKTAFYDIIPSAFAIDECNGNIYLSGWGGGLVTNTVALSSMPLMNPTQSVTTGYDFYLMALSPNATSLLYGSYFGGSSSQEHVDGGTSRFDRRGIIYQSVCAGCGGNQDFPVTSGAWPCPGSPTCALRNLSGNCNNGVFKINFLLQNAIASVATATLTGCVPLTVTLSNVSPGTSYTWNLGSGNTTSTIPSPVVTFSTAGTHTISLLVMDTTRCIKRDSTILTFTVNPKPAAGFTLASTPCSNTVSTNNQSTGNFGANPYTWSQGNGNPTVSAISPTFTYNTSGTYTISLTVKDQNGCTDTKTGTLSVLAFSPAIAGNLSLCLGAGGTITASGGTNYTWTPSTFLSSSVVASPVVNPTVTTIYTVNIFDNTFGFSCSKTLTTAVTVFPLPTASFSLLSALCTNTVATSNLSSGNFGSSPYAWEFGQGGIIAQQSPTYTYTADGTFTVKLTVTDLHGCKAVKTSTVSVLNFTPGVVVSSTICNGQTRAMFAAGGNSYTWTPGGSLSNHFISNPVASPKVTTVYTVDITNNSQGYNCARSLTTQVLVNPTPTTAFSYSFHACGGGVYFYDASKGDVSSWQWSLAPAVSSTSQNPYYFYSSGGTYTVTLTTENEWGCKSSGKEVLQVPAPPAVAINSPLIICKGSSAQLFASGGIRYQWTPSVTLDFPTIADPTATPLVNTDYSVAITTPVTVNGLPCEYTLSTSITLNELSKTPVSGKASPAMVNAGEPATLSYIGDPGATVTWLPANTTTPSTGYVVTAYPDKPTTYTAVASRGACARQVEVHVDAYTEDCIDSDVFIPNTFTPNGDGVNDQLFVRGIKVESIYFAVYNRWGEMVFETKDKAKGWDGIYKNKPSDVGVFGWYLKAKCFNGIESFKKGNVTLIR